MDSNTSDTKHAGPVPALDSGDLLAIPVAYRLPWTRIHLASDWQRAEVVATHFKDGVPDKWAVRECGSVLAKDGEWEIEPSPSNRDADFLERTRFSTPEAAALCAARFFSANILLSQGAHNKKP